MITPRIHLDYSQSTTIIVRFKRALMTKQILLSMQNFWKQRLSRIVIFLRIMPF